MIKYIKKHEILGKVGLLFIVLLISIFVKCQIVDDTVSKSDSSKEDGQVLMGQMKLKKKRLASEDYIKETIASMKETNNTFLSWSILLLGGTFGLIISNRSYNRRDNNWTLVLIPSAWFFLGYSLYYGIYIKARLSFLLATENFDPFLLNRELWYQCVLFWSSLIPLAMIMLIYFFIYLLFKRQLKEGDENE